MLKLAACSAFIICLSISTAGNAAYIIKLKNGKEFVTSRYWQEGKQIMFDTYGGTFGIDRTSISKIEVSDKPVRIETTPQDPPQEKPQKQGAEEVKEPQRATSPTEIRREDDPILREFYALKEQSKGFEGMLTSELLEFSKNLTDFKKKIQASKKTNNYLRELFEASKMGDAMEAVLKSRGQ